jgi:iron-sulfur cluster assembly protein
METTLRRPRPAPVTVTEAASARIAEIIAKAPADAIGVRLTTPKRGCSGLAYDLAYVTEAKPGDEKVETPGGTLYIDGGSLMYLLGSVMDWREDDFSAAFVFENPNAKGSCGCGESFMV